MGVLAKEKECFRFLLLEPLLDSFIGIIKLNCEPIPTSDWISSLLPIFSRSSCIVPSPSPESGMFSLIGDSGISEIADFRMDEIITE